MLNDQTTALEQFQAVLQKLTSANLVRATICDDVLLEYKQLMREAKLSPGDFSVEDKRLDAFYFARIGNVPEKQKLWDVIQMLLVLSHGQAIIERGFSVNSDVLHTNMAAKTIVSRRIVHDAIHSENCDVHEIDIPGEMLKACHHARSQYQGYLDEEKKKNASKEQDEAKRKLRDDLSDARNKKTQIESTVATLMKEADSFAVEAEKKQKMDLLSKSNAFQQKAAEKRKCIADADKRIESLLKKLKSYD